MTQGVRTFSVVWSGQLVSLLGSGLTAFALGVWIFQLTGSVTRFTLVSVAATLPTVIFSPFAGALVDRWNHRVVMIVADLVAACSALVIAGLLVTERLETWHIYVGTGLGAAAGAFQLPAYSAAVALLVPPEHLGRAAGMVQFARAGARTLAPLLAGILIVEFHIHGILLIDFATFLCAVTSLLLVRIPAPGKITAGAQRGKLTSDIRFAWSYLTARPGLIRLLLFFNLNNLFCSQALGLTVPLILAFNDADTLGFTLSIAACGMVFGGLVMGFWGGPKRQIYGVLGAGSLLPFCFVLVGSRPSLAPITVGLFGFNFAIAVMNSSSQAIWQRKVPPDLQGRIFAFRRTFAMATTPVGFLLAGPLVDWVLEPLLTVDGPLAGNVGRLLGVGPGRGIGFYFLVLGLICGLIALWGWRTQRLVQVELDLPDQHFGSRASD